jgi:hypothetical protein
MTLHRMELIFESHHTLIASHHFNTPTGPWFDLLRPHLTLVPARVPTKIFGNELRHFAHRSDVSTEHGSFRPPGGRSWITSRRTRILITTASLL